MNKQELHIDLHDKITEAYYGLFGINNMNRTRKRIHWICSKVVGGNILDIGCSQGILPLLLGREGKSVTGIDSSQKAIDYAKKQLLKEEKQVQKNIHFIQDDFLHYHFNIKFDTIIIAEVLEHLVNPQNFIDKIQTLLSPRGKLIITVPFGINDFIDHKKTYYYADLHEMLQKSFSVTNINLLGKWIGVTSLLNEDNSSDLPHYIHFDTLKNIESSFFAIERNLLDTRNALLQRVDELENKYSDLTNYNIELKNEIENSKFIQLEYKRLYEETKNELEDYKGSRLKYKRLYEETKKELEDYKGSRLKYKRLYEETKKVHTKILTSASYNLGLAFTSAIKNPGKNTLLLPYKIIKIISTYMEKDKNTTLLSLSSKQLKPENIRSISKLQLFIEKTQTQPVILLFGEISLNVVDGSSIWLSSMYNTCISSANVILLSKQDIQKDLITSNFIKTSFESLIIEPKDLDITDELNVIKTVQILNYLDEAIPNIQLLIVRGMSTTAEICKTNNFKYRLLPYLTNFYTHTTDGPVINESVKKTFEIISPNVKQWLWQTPQMKDFVSKHIDIDFSNSIVFPPILPEMQISKYPNNKEEKTIWIGYAGKIQPDWGVLELLEEVKKLRKNGYNIKLKIISSKISYRSDLVSGDGFIEKVKKLLNENYVDYIQNVNREKSINLLSKMDYIWCFRPEYFEANTLELSTKLLEAIALAKPTICYPNEINQKLLGRDYPFYLSTIESLKDILAIKEDGNIKKLSEKIIKNYSLEKRIVILKELLTKTKEKIILFAGHDFKFIDHFYSYSKSQGYQIYKDTWEWGHAQSLERSEELYNKSDIIFCEWGLANAVWYSNRNKENKPLFVRIHAQESRKPALALFEKIDFNNVKKNIFVSSQIKEKLNAVVSIQDKKNILIPNYLLSNDFKIHENKLFNYNFGMVGITPKSKRLDRAISFIELALVKYPNAKLYIKGERPENFTWMHSPGRVSELEYFYEQYRRIDKSPILKDAVIFDGFGNDMIKWYQKIDFILSPSDAESFHYGLADGILSGAIPIIWSWDGSNVIYKQEWIIDSRKEGIKIIEKFLTLSKAKQKEIIHKNRKFMLAKFDYVLVYERLGKLLYSQNYTLEKSF